MTLCVGGISSPDISDLDPIRRRGTQTERAGKANVVCRVTDGRQTRAHAPLLQMLQRNGIQSHRIFARIECSMMHRVIWLRLRPTGVLRDQAIHQIENDFLADERVAVNFGDALRAEASALSETTPVVDVWNCHIVKATGDAVHFTAAHHRHIDDFRHLSRNDAREMTDVACVLSVGKDRHFHFVGPIIKITPNQFPN
jgi:hypothetical protein